jgi:Ser/Thr protein kinase RdoA (MazF antagonist)
MGVMCDLEWRSVLAEFLPGQQFRAIALGNRGGFSGAALWRIEADHRLLCLKAWPEQPGTVNQLEQIHRLTTRARQAGLLFVPEVRSRPAGATWARSSNRLWDLTGWMPGAADFHDQPNSARLSAASIALGRIHAAWQVERSIGPCPAIARRLDALSDWNKLLNSGWRLNIRDMPDPPWRAILLRAGDVVRATLPRLEAMLSAWHDRSVPLQVCIGDVWHDHILFQGDSVSGVIDFGGLRIDHVATDIGRLIGSLIGDDDNSWATALAAYRTIRPLTWEEEALARLLDQTGVVVSLTNWLRWMGNGERTFSDPAPVIQRVQQLVTRVEGWKGQAGIFAE